LFWREHVPLKVSVFVWRLIRNRFPAKDTLARRGVMTNDDQLCVSGCCELETTDHLFLNCNYFGSLWNLVRDLLGFLSVDPRSITEHFV